MKHTYNNWTDFVFYKQSQTFQLIIDWPWQQNCRLLTYNRIVYDDGTPPAYVHITRHDCYYTARQALGDRPARVYNIVYVTVQR